MQTEADLAIAKLEQRGFTVDRASGGDLPAAEAELHAQLSREIEDPGPLIVRVTGPDIDVTLPADAAALDDLCADIDAAAERAGAQPVEPG